MLGVKDLYPCIFYLESSPSKWGIHSVWEEYVFCWVESSIDSSIDVNYILLIDGVAAFDLSQKAEKRWLMVLLSSAVSLLIFHLLCVSISVTELLRSPSLMADSFISPRSSANFCLTYFDALLLGAYTLRIVVSSRRLGLLSLCSAPPIPDNLSHFEVCLVWN